LAHADAVVKALEVGSMSRHIRIGDLVQVVAGADRTNKQQGKVIGVDAERGKVRVEKARMQKRHLKPGRKIARTGGILDREGWIDASNVMLVDPDTGRPGRVRTERDENGRRVRVFVKSGARVPEPSRG
jgi:large subunit ribosomal protein L24